MPVETNSADSIGPCPSQADSQASQPANDGPSPNRIFLVIKETATGTIRTRELKCLNDLATHNEIVAVVENSEQSAPVAASTPAAENNFEFRFPRLPTALPDASFAMSASSQATNLDDNHAPSEASSFAPIRRYPTQSHHANEAASSSAPLQPSNPMPTITEQQATPVSTDPVGNNRRKAKRSLNSALDSIRLTRSAAKRACISANRERPAANDYPDSSDSDESTPESGNDVADSSYDENDSSDNDPGQAENAGSDDNAEPAENEENAGDSNDADNAPNEQRPIDAPQGNPNDENAHPEQPEQAPAYQPGAVAQLPPFQGNGQTRRYPPASNRPANQLFGAFNINWNVPRGRTNPDGIASSGI